MQGIIDLLKGERGILAILLILACTVLVALGHATFDQWRSFAETIFITFVAGKTLTTSVGLFSSKGTSAGSAT